eukprot:Pgem_evm1s3352
MTTYNTLDSICNACFEVESSQCQDAITYNCVNTTGFIIPASICQTGATGNQQGIEDYLITVCSEPFLLTMIQPYNLGFNFLMPLIILIAILLFNKISKVTMWHLYHKFVLQKSVLLEYEREKVLKLSCYVSEIVITTGCFVFLLSQISYIGPIIFTYNHLENNPDALQIATESIRTIGFIGFVVSILYIYEITIIPRMQKSLILHHCVVIMFAMVILVLIEFLIESGPAVVIPFRLAICALLYALTEQMAFVFMLLYRFRLRQTSAKVFLGLAWSYILTRLLIFVLCLSQAIIVIVQLVTDDNSNLTLQSRNAIIAFLVIFLISVLIAFYTQWICFVTLKAIAERVKSKQQKQKLQDDDNNNININININNNNNNNNNEND